MSSHNTSQSNLSAGNKIGIFGGTFDPIHIGHIKPISFAINALDLNEVHIIPANIPPHKNNTYTTPKHRANMVQLVCNEVDKFHFNDCELQRDKASYTVDTLLDVHTKAQTKNKHTKVYFFIGMDSLLNFTSWHRWQDILSLCHLVVLPRPGYQLKNLPIELHNKISHFTDNDSLNKPLINKYLNDNNTGNIIIMPEYLEDISSTELRNKLKDKEDVSPWLLPSVLQYIKQHQLYSDFSTR